MHADGSAAAMEFPGPHQKPDLTGDATAAPPIHLCASAFICCLSALSLACFAVCRTAATKRDATPSEGAMMAGDAPTCWLRPTAALRSLRTPANPVFEYGALGTDHQHEQPAAGSLYSP